MTNLPADWDTPSPENDILCQKFGYGIFDPEGLKMPYRIYEPETDQKVPLVVYLHGADAVGNDNEQPLAIHDIGTMFARDEWQKQEPCYIIAPQYGQGQHWSIPGIGMAVISLIEEIRARYSIDQSRIYIYGYSAGGVGTLRLVKENPGYFSGAVSICGATGKSDIENLTATPLWMIHAEDDRIVKTDYQDGRSWIPTHFGSRNIYDALHDMSQRIHYTEFPTGWMEKTYKVNPHCSWVVMSDPVYPEYARWLFLQKKYQL